MPVFNIQKKTLEELDPVATVEGLASGTHLPPPGEGVLFNPDGELVFMPQNAVADSVLKYGYRIPQPDELRKAGRDYKYGSDSMQLQAGLAGLARGTTLGVSDWLTTLTGLSSPEHLSALKEYYPGASIAGEIGGALATAPLRLTPVGAAVTGARALEAAAIGRAASLLPKSAMASAIAKTAVEAGAKGLGGAVEGLAFGLGQTVSESALGNPDLNAENIVAHLGQSALLGGALGAGISLGSVGLKKALEGAKKAYSYAFEKMIGKVRTVETETGGIPGVKFDFPESEVTPSDIASQVSQPDVKAVLEPSLLTKGMAKVSSALGKKPVDEFFDDIAERITDEKIFLTPNQIDSLARTIKDTTQPVYDSMLKLRARLGKPLRKAETETILADADMGKALGLYDDVISNIKSKLEIANVDRIQALKSLGKDITPEEKAELANLIKQAKAFYHTGYVTEVENILTSMEMNKAKITNANDVFRQLDDAKQAMDAVIDRFYKDQTRLPYKQLKTALNIVKPSVDFIRSGLEDENIWGLAGARQAAYNSAITDLSNSMKVLEKFVMQKVPRPSGGSSYVMKPSSLREMMNMYKDARAGYKLEALRDFYDKAGRFLDQVDETAKVLPAGRIDTSGVRNFVKTAVDKSSTIENIMERTDTGLGFFSNLVNELTNKGIIPAGVAAIRGVTDPENLVSILIRMEKMARGTETKVSKGAKIIFEKIKPPTRGIGVQWDKMTPTERSEKYKDYIKKLKTLSDVPESMLDSIENSTRESFEAAPKISQALQMAQVRGVSFLLQKMPRPIDQNILDDEYEPSQAEMLTFGRYYEAVENPMVVMEQLQENYVTKETMEVMRQVYPAFYANAKTQVLENLLTAVEKKTFIPYQKRLVLSQFLEMPLDSTLKPEVIKRNQDTLAAMYRKEQAEEAAQAKAPSQAGLKEVSLSERSKTGLEKVTSRA